MLDELFKLYYCDLFNKLESRSWFVFIWILVVCLKIIIMIVKNVLSLKEYDIW